MTISPKWTIASKYQPMSPLVLLREYCGGCKRQAYEWLFEKAAQKTPPIILALAGYITEVTNWI